MNLTPRLRGLITTAISLLGLISYMAASQFGIDALKFCIAGATAMLISMLWFSSFRRILDRAADALEVATQRTKDLRQLLDEIDRAWRRFWSKVISGKKRSSRRTKPSNAK